MSVLPQVSAVKMYTCTVSLKKKKKRNTAIYFNTNYRNRNETGTITMDYCLLQFDALKFFLGVRLHERRGST